MPGDGQLTAGSALAGWRDDEAMFGDVPPCRLGGVSVICTVRNESRHVHAALTSALAAEVAELIVVDDGSTDGTGEILQALARGDRRVRVIAGGSVGRARAIATALHATRHAFVMNLDADDLVDPAWIGIAQSILQGRPAFAAVSARPIYITVDDTVQWPSQTRDLALQDVTARLAFYNPLVHSSTMMRRDAALHVGGYDVRRHTQVDWELWNRLAAAGWRVGAVSARLVAKRLHAGQKFEVRGRLRYLLASGAMQIGGIRAVQGGPLAWVVLPARLAWGLLPRRFRIGVRRFVAVLDRRSGPNAAPGVATDD
jgi:glycosyltransferase involved in cell wall biosynthesis